MTIPSTVGKADQLQPKRMLMFQLPAQILISAYCKSDSGVHQHKKKTFQPINEVAMLVFVTMKGQGGPGSFSFAKAASVVIPKFCFLTDNMENARVFTKNVY